MVKTHQRDPEIESKNWETLAHYANTRFRLCTRKRLDLGIWKMAVDEVPIIIVEERERDRSKERQTDRQTDRQTHG